MIYLSHLYLQCIMFIMNDLLASGRGFDGDAIGEFHSSPHLLPQRVRPPTTNCSTLQVIVRVTTFVSNTSKSIFCPENG